MQPCTIPAGSSLSNLAVQDAKQRSGYVADLERFMTAYMHMFPDRCQANLFSAETQSSSYAHEQQPTKPWSGLHLSS